MELECPVAEAPIQETIDICRSCGTRLNWLMLQTSRDTTTHRASGCYHESTTGLTAITRT